MTATFVTHAPASEIALRSLRAKYPTLPREYLAFLTEHYQPTPLVVRGYGAGGEVTAAGVLADILKIASFEGLP